MIGSNTIVICVICEYENQSIMRSLGYTYVCIKWIKKKKKKCISKWFV
jgi:hypothetical protein